MFGPPNRLRRIALRVLVMWLFAVVTSVVHACVIAPGIRLAASGADGTGSHHAAAATAVHQHGGHGSEHRHGAPKSENAACLKFCSDESASAPAAKQTFDPAPSATLAPPLAVVPPSIAPVGRGLGAGGFLETARPPVPIAIAFVRLTL